MTRRMAGSIPGAAALLVLGLSWLPAADGPPAAAAASAEAKPLEAGDPAPPFRLQGSDGKTWSLADFKGKKAVVLAWFPKAFTGG
jgi:cytochrome oxidase Cu insertion factor (SCO1/SenC/PrrC family)